MISKYLCPLKHDRDGFKHAEDMINILYRKVFWWWKMDKSDARDTSSYIYTENKIYDNVWPVEWDTAPQSQLYLI